MCRFDLALKALFLSIAALIVMSAPSFAQTLRVVGANSASASGLVGGLQGGYNWQNGSAVYGFETDFSGTNLKSSADGGLACIVLACSSFTPPPTASVLSKVDWYGTVRGRFGWAAGPIMLYGTGGLAYGHVGLKSNLAVAGNNFGEPDLSSSTQASSIRAGWVFGGGIEYLLHRNMVLSFAYQHVDLGTVSSASVPQSTACCDGFVVQNASVHAQFQVVRLGLSWKFAPILAAATSNSWEGGYFGGHLGGGWGNSTIANYLAYFFSCFTATTQVLMADGSSRPIAAVRIGDEVLGENGAVNRVVDIETPVLGSRKLYAFNGGPAFVTPEHPFMTHAGWKSIAPEATFAENNSFPVDALKVGDELVRLETVTTRARPVSVALGGTAQAASVEVLVDTKLSRLESMVPQDGDPFMTVYNLRLDGNHTYFANSYLVHNK